MNKTYTAHVGGMVFHIEEPAYETLSDYLHKLRAHFANTQGGEEIIMDIESRIAEIFSESILKEKKTAVDLELINKMIQVMGSPDQFDDGIESIVDESSKNEQYKSNPNNMNTNANAFNSGKRLFRNEEDKVISGVCSGMSAYFGITDPLWIRLIFVGLLAISFGFWFIIYIILSIIIPAAKSSSDKLSMRGESINVSSIEKTVKEGIDNLSANLNDFRSSNTSNTLNTGIHSVLNAFITLIGVLGKILIKIFYWFAIFIAVIVGLSLVTAAIALFASMVYVGPHISHIFIPNNVWTWPAYLGMFLLAAIPIAIALLYILPRFFNVRIPYRGRILGISLAVLFFAFILCAFTGIKYATEFRRTSQMSANILTQDITGDTMVLATQNRDYFEQQKDSYMSNHIQLGSIAYNDNNILINDVNFDIQKSLNNKVEIIKEVKSNGRSREEAMNFLQNVQYGFNVNDKNILLDPYFEFQKADKFHNQRLNLTMMLPVGKTVFIDQSMEEMLHDVKNVHNTWDGDMVGHYWTMTEEGLSCNDCPNNEKSKIDSNNQTHFNTSSGNWSTQAIDDVDAIEVAGNLQIMIVKGDETSYSISSPEDDDIEIEVKGNKLQFSNKEDFSWSWNSNDFDHKHKVKIVLNNLKDLEVTGASKVEVSGFDLDQVDINISGASTLDMNSDVKRMSIEITGVSKAVLVGKSERLDASVSGASKLNSEDFITSEVDVKASGASKAEVYAAEAIEAKGSGASHITYKGNPSNVQKDESGSSKIKAE